MPAEALRELVELRRAILARPDEPSLRRVFADALIERGNPRGEFIRVQCDLAELGEHAPPGAPMRSRLTTLERQLLHRHQVAWFTPLRRERFRQAVLFERGFAARWSCHPHHFLLGGRWAVSHHPLPAVALRRVSEADLARLGTLEAFTSRTEVTLNMVGQPWLPVSRVPFTALKRLAVDGVAIAPGPGFAEVCAAPWWRGLEAVDLSYRLLEDDVRALEASGLLTTVRSLGLRAGALRVRCPEVTSLKLSLWLPDRHPLAPLFPLVPKLRTLTLNPLVSSVIGGEALAGLPPGVTSLRLVSARLSEANVDALVGNPRLARLDLQSCRLSAASYDRLRLRWDDRGWRCVEEPGRRRLPR